MLDRCAALVPRVGQPQTLLEVQKALKDGSEDVILQKRRDPGDPRHGRRVVLVLLGNYGSPRNQALTPRGPLLLNSFSRVSAHAWSHTMMQVSATS